MSEKMNNVEQIRNCLEGVLEFEGKRGAVWYQVKGHVDKIAFQEALRLETGVCVSLTDVTHCHLRNIPAGPDMPGKWYSIQSKPGRGAYPVTQVYVAG